jgi:hypothetical protein
VDEDLRFQVTWPGEGWTLLDAGRARERVPDAVAGAEGRKGVHGAVIVERIEATDLAAVAARIAGNVQLQGKAVTSFTPLTFAGEKAIRWGTSGTINGTAVHFEHTVLLHEGHLYQVLVYAPGGMDAWDDREFRAFTQAFSLLPGPVRDRADVVAVADAAGVGWRLRGGVYENAAHGVRVTPRSGWRVAVGNELDRLNASAEFGLVRSSPDAYVVALCERAPPESERAAYTAGTIGRTARTVGGAVVERPSKVEIAGVSVSLTEYTTSDVVPLRYLHGMLFRGREAIQLLGWTAVAGGDEARDALVAGLGAIELLGDDARLRLRRELEGRPDPRSLVGPDWSFRRDVYRDFGRGFLFRRSGLWRLEAGDRADAHHDGAVLWLDEPALGLMAYVTVARTEADAETAHRQEAAARLFAPEGPMPAQLGGLGALRSSGEVRSETVRLRWEVTTLRLDRQLYTVHVWGLPADMVPARAEIDRLLGAFQFGGSRLEPPAARDGVYRDPRLGFSYRPPAGHWESEDLTPSGAAGGMRVRHWSRGGHDIVATAVAIQDQSPPVVRATMEYHMRAMLGAEAEPETATIGGQRCQKASRRKGLLRREVYALDRDGIAYLLMVSAPFIGSGSFFASAPAGFAFLD